MPETLNATPSQVQRACTKTRLMAYLRTNQLGYVVYVETPTGRRSFYGETGADAWLSMGQVFANESSAFADALRYFIAKDAPAPQQGP